MGTIHWTFVQKVWTTVVSKILTVISSLTFRCRWPESKFEQLFKKGDREKHRMSRVETVSILEWFEIVWSKIIFIWRFLNILKVWSHILSKNIKFATISLTENRWWFLQWLDSKFDPKNLFSEQMRFKRTEFMWLKGLQLCYQLHSDLSNCIKICKTDFVFFNFKQFFPSSNASFQIKTYQLKSFQLQVFPTTLPTSTHAYSLFLPSVLIRPSRTVASPLAHESWTVTASFCTN